VFMEMTQLRATLGSPPVELARAALTSTAVMPLSALAVGTPARVVSVSDGDSAASVELARRLAELGFLPGERLRIVARGFLGREPLAVRIGTGTFALRLFEAASVRVSVEQPQHG
jgi:ferrous iron transport protein A